jgi:hypothetical protein
MRGDLFGRPVNAAAVRTMLLDDRPKRANAR